MGDGMIETIQRFADQTRINELLPGLAISVWKEGQIDQSFFSGFADVEAGISVTQNTIFQLGSISKTYTAILVFKLIEEGKLSLDDSLGSLLKEKLNNCVDKRTGDIKIADLLAHRSGLPFGVPDVFSATEIISEIKQAQLLFAPGSSFKYSTIGYSLLGLIAEIVSRVDYKTLVRQYILNKAELNNTFVVKDFENAELRTCLAQSYSLGIPFNCAFDQSELKPTGIFEATPASAGIFSSISDLAYLGKILLEQPADIAHSILSAQSFDIFLRSSDAEEDKSKCLSGMLYSKWKDAAMVYQTGYSVGQSCALITFPKQKMVIALACNRWKKHAALLKAAYRLFDCLQHDEALAFISNGAMVEPDDISGDFTPANGEGDTLSISKKNESFYISNGRYSLLLKYLGKNIWTTIGFKTDLLFAEFADSIIFEIIWKDKVYYSKSHNNSSDTSIIERFGQLIGVYQHKNSSMWYVGIKKDKLVCMHNEEFGELEELADNPDDLLFKINGTYFYDLENARFSRDGNQVLSLRLGNAIHIKI